MTQMTVHSRFTDTHFSGYFGKSQSAEEMKLDNPPRLRSQFRGNKFVKTRATLLVKGEIDFFALVIERIGVGYPLMNVAVADMIHAPVADGIHQIAARHKDVILSFKQRSKDILNDVGGTFIIVQNHRGQPVHLREMKPEKLFYVISIRHTPI